MRTDIFRHSLLAFLLLAVCGVIANAQGRPAENQTSIDAGKKTYQTRCVGCHGLKGDGNGAAASYMLPQPRDFTKTKYKLRSTLTGERPLEEDLFRTLTNGIPGTEMPAWTNLSDEQRWQLVYYIKSFAREDFDEELPEDVIVKQPDVVVTPDATTLARGKKVYKILKCFECHGDEGRGNGPNVRKLSDDFGTPMWPGNLARIEDFRGGAEVTDIARALMTGLDSTPMPSYADFFGVFELASPPESMEMTQEEWETIKASRWENALALAYYVLSLGEDERSQYAEGLEVRAELIDGEIPNDPDDSRWKMAKGVKLKLSPQIYMPPRWQFANADEVLVHALYNEKEIGFLVMWNDRTEDKIHSEASAEAQELGQAVFPTREDLAARRKQAFADGVAIQFPLTTPEGMQKPHFVMGSPEHPIEVLRFRADRGGTVYTAEGVSAGWQSTDKTDPVGSAKFDGGMWKVVFKIPVEGDPRFVPGEYLPISFKAWDGANGESGLRCSLSSWYKFVMVPRHTSTALIASILAFPLFFVGQLFLIGKLKRSQLV